MDIDSILAAKQPARRTVPILLDPEVEQELIDATSAHARAQDRADRQPTNSAAAADLTMAAVRLDRARARAREVTATFVFQAIGREAFETLRAEHAPTKAQRDEYRKQALAAGIPPHQAGELAHNPDTFPPALIAASCIDPVMTVDKAVELWNSDRFSTADLADLFSAAQLVNQVSRRVDLGEG